MNPAPVGVPLGQLLAADPLLGVLGAEFAHFEPATLEELAPAGLKAVPDPGIDLRRFRPPPQGREQRSVGDGEQGSRCGRQTKVSPTWGSVRNRSG